MKRMQIIGLALVAVFAMSAVAASVASAQLPEFVRCAKVAAGEPSSWEAGCTKAKVGGGYAKVSAGPGLCVKVAPGEPSSWANATCTTAGTGFIKIAAAGKPKFTSASGLTELETVSGTKVICKKDTNKGELTGDQTDTVTITFTECTFEGKPCTTGKEPAGTIVTNLLASKLVYLNEAHTIVGLALTPQAGPGKLFAEFVCEFLKTTVKVGVHEEGKGGMDSVLGTIEPINTWVVPPATFKLVYKCTAKGKQEWTSYWGEGGKFITDFLEAENSILKKWEQSCIRSEAGDLLTLEEAGEIRG
jgi:hypothetical protein